MHNSMGEFLAWRFSGPDQLEWLTFGPSLSDCVFHEYV
jgi:hypothetical protein